MKLHEVQAAVAEKTVKNLLLMDGRKEGYDGEFITDPYKIRAAVADALLQVWSLNK